MKSQWGILVKKEVEAFSANIEKLDIGLSFSKKEGYKIKEFGALEKAIKECNLGALEGDLLKVLGDIKKYESIRHPNEDLQKVLFRDIIGISLQLNRKCKAVVKSNDFKFDNNLRVALVGGFRQKGLLDIYSSSLKVYNKYVDNMVSDHRAGSTSKSRFFSLFPKKHISLLLLAAVGSLALKDASLAGLGPVALLAVTEENGAKEERPKSYTRDLLNRVLGIALIGNLFAVIITLWAIRSGVPFLNFESEEAFKTFYEGIVWGVWIAAGFVTSLLVALFRYLKRKGKEMKKAERSFKSLQDELILKLHNSNQIIADQRMNLEQYRQYVEGMQQRPAAQQPRQEGAKVKKAKKIHIPKDEEELEEIFDEEMEELVDAHTFTRVPKS